MSNKDNLEVGGLQVGFTPLFDFLSCSSYYFFFLEDFPWADCWVVHVISPLSPPHLWILY